MGQRCVLDRAAIVPGAEALAAHWPPAGVKRLVSHHPYPFFWTSWPGHLITGDYGFRPGSIKGWPKVPGPCGPIGARFPIWSAQGVRGEVPPLGSPEKGGESPDPRRIGPGLREKTWGTAVWGTRGKKGARST